MNATSDRRYQEYVAALAAAQAQDKAAKEAADKADLQLQMFRVAVQADPSLFYTYGL